MRHQVAPDLRLETLMRKEWLLPNGRGGYASGTFAGINTRKYHGLLISGFDDKGSRYLHVGALEEKVTIGEHRYFFRRTNTMPIRSILEASCIWWTMVRHPL